MINTAAIIGQIKRYRAELAEALAKGAPSSFEAYQRFVGRIQGLDEALQVIDQLIEEEKNG